MDKGAEETERLIKRMEREITKQFQQAAEEMSEKLEKRMQKFSVRDEEKRKAVADGKITPEDYQKWRRTQILDINREAGLIEEYAKVLHRTTEVARSTAKGYQPDAYAANMNYATYQIEKDLEIDTSFTLWDRQTVERLMRDEPKLLPDPRPDSETARKLAERKDLRWNRQHLTSALEQSILQGESVPEIAKRLQSVAAMDLRAATRNARTMMTGAQNAGRDNAYKRAKDMGIKLIRVWIATLDGRTRHEHRMLDGRTAEVDEPFEVEGYEIRYPGDPEAEPFLTYNCRCTTIAQIKGFRYDTTEYRDDPNIGGMTYEEWKKEKAKPKQGRKTEGTKKEVPKKTNADVFKNVRGVTDEFRTGMAEVLSRSQVPEAVDVFTRFADELVCVDPTTKGACFRRGYGGVFMNLPNVASGSSYETPYEVAFHEFGHMIDWLAGGRDWQYLSNKPIDGATLLETIKKDFQAFKKSVGASKAADVIPILKEEQMDLRTCGNISDILEKCTGVSYPLGIGHGVSYHRNAGATEREFFAEVLDSAVANPESYAQMRRLFPNAVAMVWKMIGGVL